MDLQIIDTFVRSEAAPKAAPRSTDDAHESFADILDSRLKASEPMRERSEMPEARETPREAPEAKPVETTEPRTAEPAPAAKAHTKPKAEHEAKDTPTSEVAATDSEEATPEKAPVAKSTNAVVVAELLNAADNASADNQPATPDVVATLVANATPEKTVITNPILSLLTTAGAPQPEDVSTPTTAAPAQAAAGTPAQTQAPATTPSANTAAADFAQQLNAAAAETPAPAATPPPVKLPEAPVVAAEIAATTPAATAIAAEIQPQTDKSDALDLAADLLDSADSDDILATVSLASPSTTASRAAPTPSTTSGYAAQLVSQDPTSASSSAPTPDVVKPAEITASPDKGAQSADLTAEGDKTLLTTMAATTSSSDNAVAAPSTTDHTVRASAQAEAAAQRGTRPAALPVVEQVAVRINKAISDGVDRITVKLNPADLGQIDIRMEIGPDGKFNAVFAADRPQTVELLQRDARELARSLQDAGLRTDAGSLSFNLRGQNQGQANGSQSGTPQHAGSDSSSGTDLPAEAMPMPANLYNASNAANGRVDIRV